MKATKSDSIEIRAGLEAAYDDVYTPKALAAIRALAHLDRDVKAVQRARIERRSLAQLVITASTVSKPASTGARGSGAV